MNCLRITTVAIVATLLGAATVRSEDSLHTGYQLARANGCLICHEVESRAAGSPLPAAPAFQDIARRYRSQSDAASRLTALVREGSGPLRRDRHWAGKVTFERMPNDFVVTEPEARQIVDWILTVDATRGRRDATHEQRQVQ